MKLFCPQCGTGGKADTECYQKKVRCPSCAAVFKITDELIVTESWAGAERSIELESALQLEATEVSGGDDQLEAAPDRDRSEQGVCSRCGFRFSKDFLQLLDDQPVCAVCAG